MYLGVLSCEINIGGKYTIRGLETLEIKKSVHTLVNTAKLTLPLSYVVRNNDIRESVKLIDKIKEGDSIKIAIGYNGNNKNIYKGFIKRINHKQPLELELEDDLYLFNKLELKKSFPNNDVKDVLQYLVDECALQFGKRIKLYANIPKQQLTNFLVKDVNGLTVLKELEKWGLHSFLINVKGEQVLYCGLLYGIKNNTVKYIINKNTISVDDLKFTNAEDKSYKVTFIYNDQKGKIHRKTFGEKLGVSLEKVELHGKFTDAEIERMAKAKMDAAKTSGYKGSFETFIVPVVEIGDIAALQDLQFPNRSANYYIAAVTTMFGVGGGRNKIEIDFKVA
jgi:hypothetical protein